ncbi:MAG: hypothetical protein OXF56_23940 [Rhodobacteraceae bacterium]|nr:hypothetical protein [Paracoccaceae bacterium]
MKRIKTNLFGAYDYRLAWVARRDGDMFEVVLDDDQAEILAATLRELYCGLHEGDDIELVDERE